MTALTWTEQALALANPTEANQPRDANISHENLRMLTYIVWNDGVRGSTTFGYARDETKYDTGHIIVVSYKRNVSKQDCVENETLDYDSYLLPEVAYDHVLPQLHLEGAGHIIRATLETIEDSIKISITGSGHISFPQVPPSLRVPHLPITSLSRITQTIHLHVDLVNVSGQPYAFKHHGIDPCNGTQSPYDLKDSYLLKEVMHLSRFDSIFIVKPIFLIVGSDLTSFRGYLMPYSSAGSLAAVLRRLNIGINVSTESEKDLDLSPCDATLHTMSHLYNTKSDSFRDVSNAARKKMLHWSLKEAWAFQIISGVMSLHSASSFSGDLKLDNILLGHDGHLCLIDTAPTNGFTLEYLSPEQNFQNLVLNGPRDIFALGLILWALSEEVPYFQRSDISLTPQLLWHGGRDAAPMWYRELVYSCIGEADKRPSAETLLAKFHSLGYTLPPYL